MLVFPNLYASNVDYGNEFVDLRSIILFISSDHMSTSSKNTDESLGVAIVVTKSDCLLLYQFRTRRTLWGPEQNILNCTMKIKDNVLSRCTSVNA